MDKLSQENTCRICFKTQDTVYSLFRKRKGISPCEKLNKIGLKTDINDVGPLCICCECLTELETTLIFLEKCEKSNQILAEQYSQGLDFMGNKDNLNLEIDNNAYIENRVEEAIQVVNSELNISEEVKTSEILGLEDVKCGECGSRRRCQHWTPPATHTCPYCQKEFSRKFNFKLHLKRHSGERDWSCARCGASAVSRWLAARHCAPRHRRPCPVPGCGKTYTTNTNLNTHLRIHSGERPFECSECEKKFTSKNTLNDHMRIHTGALPYICPICGKRFRTNKLSAHMSTHSGARHTCPRPACGKRFASGAALRRHARSHAARAVPPAAHACRLCPAKYRHKQSLNKHARKQHAQHPVPVDVDTTAINKEIECDI